MEGIEILVSVCLFFSIFIFIKAGYNILTLKYSKYEEEFVRSTSKTLDEYFIFIPPEKILFMKFLSGFTIFLIVTFLAFSSAFLSEHVFVPFIFGAVAGIVGFFIPEWIINFFIKRRNEKFGEQLVDGLITISNCLRAGLSFGQGLEMMVEEMDPPISQEFGVVVKENRLGKSLEDSLNNLNARMSNPDLLLIVISVNIAREIGGNLAEIFDRIAHTIRERNVLKKKLDALTAQGKLQGIVVGCMPIGIGLVVNWMQPEMFSLLFTTITGWITIGAVVILEILGFIIIQKILDIDI